jgi:hypothetical protein
MTSGAAIASCDPLSIERSRPQDDIVSKAGAAVINQLPPRNE